MLDTNVARKIAAGDLDPTSLMLVRDEGARVHLADGALAELTKQLLTGAFAWNSWERGKPALLALIDPDEPTLLGGRQGLQRAGIPSRAPCTDVDIASTLAFHKAGWTLLSRARSLAELERSEVALPAQRLIVSLRAEQVVAAHAAHVRQWGDGFESFCTQFMARSPEVAEALPRRGDSTAAIEAYLEILQARVDEGRQAFSPPVSYRLDAYLRVDALLHLRAIRTREPYNARKHSNDTFDCDLLKYLAFPAAVCTDDAQLIAKVAASGTWQRNWVVGPEQLVDPAVRAEILTLRWPTTPLQ